MNRTLACAVLVAALGSAVMASSAMAMVRGFPMENGQLKLPSTVDFEPGSATLKPESETALSHVAAFMSDKPYVTALRIEGHTDGAGHADVELELSTARAHSVARWLVHHGVSCSRLIPVGFGATKPMNDGSTPEGRAANRRITFVPAAMKGRAIGGMPLDGGGQVSDACEP